MTDELMQLIQYTPTTETVLTTPLLIVALDQKIINLDLNRKNPTFNWMRQ